MMISSLWEDTATQIVQYPILTDLRRLISVLQSFTVVHVYREASNTVDWIVTYIANHTGFVFLEHYHAGPGMCRSMMHWTVRGYMVRSRNKN